MSDRVVIRTLEELEALPTDSVVIDKDAWAYQRDDKYSWSSCGRSWDAVQIDLPVLLLYTGGDPISIE